MRLGPRSFRAARALPALLVWAAGCEALVTGQLGDVHCLDEGWIGPPACPAGYACTAGVCAPSTLGASCSTDADCALSDVCLDPAVFGAAASDGASGGTSGSASGAWRCSRPCCDSSDCDPDAAFVCAIPPAGGSSFCRPASEIQRPTGGTLQVMAACAEDGDCRSGRCLDHRCLDTCCSDTSCAVGAAIAADAGGAGDAGTGIEAAGVCRFRQPSVDETAGFWCATPEGEAPRYAACEVDTACASGLCTSFGSFGMRCASPCCTSAECEELMPGFPVRCVTLPGPHPVRACAALGAAGGDGEVGVSCTTAEACRGGICLGQMCSDACCTDGDCGALGSFGCRPTSTEGVWALQCVLK